MKESDYSNSRELTEHFFRNEYGKIVAVVTRYLGPENVETAEDIVQETLLRAVEYWQHHGTPVNPQAWLYTTAKNLTFNILKRNKYKRRFEAEITTNPQEIDDINFSDQAIADEQLKMMFVCCHPSISEDSQIALILKILCGFSISEISNAFFSTRETINKRLVRGRKQLRKHKLSIDNPESISRDLEVVLRTIYLLFNEGYSPAQKNDVIRFDLCLEAIRLTEILVSHKLVKQKAECHALLALMYLNTSRFMARTNASDIIIEMEHQDRNNWNQGLINKGIYHLNQAIKGKKVSKYLILANISAHHCIAPSFEETNWKEILSLYDSLLKIEDSTITRLNRCIALAKAKGNKYAILELEQLETYPDMQSHHLLHATLGELYKLENDTGTAIKHLKRAITLTKNSRDSDFLRKKLAEVVPTS